MLTNALSHERMTPLKSIVNVSALVKKRCQELILDAQYVEKNSNSESLSSIEPIMQKSISPVTNVSSMRLAFQRNRQRSMVDSVQSITPRPSFKRLASDVAENGG